MTARSDPQDFREGMARKRTNVCPVKRAVGVNWCNSPVGRNHRQGRQVADDIMALPSAVVVDQLAARFTAWRRELGFDGERE